jgi:hypothetical protein
MARFGVSTINGGKSPLLENWKNQELFKIKFPKKT